MISYTRIEGNPQRSVDPLRVASVKRLKIVLNLLRLLDLRVFSV